MTKKEFDLLTKQNHGGPLEPKQWASYMDSRMRTSPGWDMLDLRWRQTQLGIAEGHRAGGHYWAQTIRRRLGHKTGYKTQVSKLPLSDLVRNLERRNG